MKNDPYSINLSKVCRLCFVEKTDLLPIFDNTNIPDLSLKIEQCVSVEISNDDQLPDQICEDCFKEIRNWIDFREKCTEADVNLKQYVQNAQVKEESGEDSDSMTTENCSSPYIETIYVLNHPLSKDDQTDSNDVIDAPEDLEQISIKTEPNVRIELPKKKKFSTYYRPQLYPCEICHKTFTRACDLLNHDNTDHENIPRIVNCDVCGKLVISEDRLTLHKQKFHTEKIYPCNICQKKFVSCKSLSRHYELHYQKFICDHCQKCFRSKNTLSTHIRKHILKQSFSCNKCDKNFSSKAGLHIHERTHSSVKLFKCDKCGFASKHQSGIYVHMLTRHGTEESIICELCGRSFKNKMRLNEHHKRKHQTPKRYACDKCDYKFKQMYQLRVHYRTHTGEKPFICEVCGKGFTRSDGLKEHRRIHHDTVVH